MPEYAAIIPLSHYRVPLLQQSVPREPTVTKQPCHRKITRTLTDINLTNEMRMLGERTSAFGVIVRTRSSTVMLLRPFFLVKALQIN